MHGSPGGRGVFTAALFAIALSFAACGSDGPNGPGPTTTTTTAPATTTTSTTTSSSTSTSSSSSTSTTSTSSSSSTTTTSSISVVTPFYGVYNVAFKEIRNDGCPNLILAPTGLLTLSGNPDGSGFRGEVFQPANGLRRIYNGTMRFDGTFEGTGSGITPGSVGRPAFAKPAHEFVGWLEGKVTGNVVEATETLRITVGCTGQPIVVYRLDGSK